jgi:class 3 adenylate cyclase
MQPGKVIQAAFEIIDFVQNEKESDDDEIAHFDIRIGINTGPVVAGVVGTKKFAYDIWGDTVNVAARMETNSQAGKINISENTYSYVKDRFECEYRGEIDVKNKGMMKMYFVTKHEASSAPHTP